MERKRIYLCLAHMSEAGEELKYVKEAFDTNWVVPLGPNVDAFEADLQKFASTSKNNEGLERITDLSSKRVAALNTGTAAVHLALIACGVEPDDEVIVQDFTFCASAPLGFVRNLTPSEMLGQIYAADAAFPEAERISGVVLMGIGEPLDNYDNVMQFLRLLSCESGRNLSLRHVSLSTCGIVPRIYELAEEQLPLTLSVSLHAAENDRRSELMPVNRRYPLDELLTACGAYFRRTGRRVTFEYAVIAGQNDSPEMAKALADRLRPVFPKQRPHVNLIPVNPVQGTGYCAGSAVKFQRMLEQYGINATVRRTLGEDIQAACGQLRRDTIESAT